jgi:hypothetical protein
MDPVTAQGAEIILRFARVFTHVVSSGCLALCIYILYFQMFGG